MPTQINKDSFLAAKKLDIYHIISLLPSMPYHEIADIGCAEGALSVPLGKLVYRGNVVSLDPIKKNLTATRRELKKARLTDEPILPLKDETLDGAMSAFPFQFFKKPEQTLKDANRCMKKGGWLAVIEWQPEFSDYGPVSKDRVQPTALREKIEKAGFKFYIRHNLSDMAYMMIFSK